MEVIEAWADGGVTETDRRTAAANAHRAAAERYRPPARNLSHASRAEWYAACAAAQVTNTSAVVPHYTPGFIAAAGSGQCAACATKFVARSHQMAGRPAAKRERRLQSGLVRDIFGNPFRPVSAAAHWLTTPVVTLAASMYEARDFTPMPILADALEEAGCDNADILTHCRTPGQHVRGCWVGDLILGKS